MLEVPKGELTRVRAELPGLMTGGQDTWSARCVEPRTAGRIARRELVAREIPHAHGELQPTAGHDRRLDGQLRGLRLQVVRRARGRRFELDRQGGHPELVLDVLPGAATSLSLEGAEDLHFVAVTPPGAPRAA